MKIQLAFVFVALCVMNVSGQIDSAGLNNIFGKKGAVIGQVYRITYPRTDLKVKVNDFEVSPGLALTSWIGIMNMGQESMMMGDLVMLDTEEPAVVAKLVSLNLGITAIHNHLVNEKPAVKFLHFSGSGDPLKLAEEIKSVITLTGTPLNPPQGTLITPAIDWSKIENVLGTKGKHNGNLLQYGFPRNERLLESGMEMPPSIGMATGINFQMSGDQAAITGDFVLMAKEVNPVVKALTENGITVTAIHNHMLFDDPRLFMLHFWAVGDPGKLATGLKAALDQTNSKK